MIVYLEGKIGKKSLSEKYPFFLQFFSHFTVFERTWFCKNGNAHVKLLELLLRIETSLLEIANKNLPMEELSKSMRKKILKKQGIY